MEPTFVIDEYQIDTTHSFLNSGCSFDSHSSPVGKKNEETHRNTDLTNVIQKSYCDSGLAVNNGHLATNKLQEDAKENEKNSPLYSGNSENTFPLTLQKSYRNSAENINANINRNSPLNSGISHSAHSSPASTCNKKNTEMSFIKELFFDKFNKYCTPLVNILMKVFRNLTLSEQTALLAKLKGHVGVYESGNPWIDLEACWLLNLREDLTKMTGNVELPKEPPLSDKIKFALAEGRHVPIQHIILGLHLSQFNPDFKEYPFDFTGKVDSEFVQKINRSDVLRAINIHSLFLGYYFPHIAVQFSNIKEYLWHFMFRQKYSAVAGMELYNEIFFNFSCNLGRGILMPLRHIPPSLVEKVKKIYRN